MFANFHNLFTVFEYPVECVLQAQGSNTGLTRVKSLVDLSLEDIGRSSRSTEALANAVFPQMSPLLPNSIRESS